MRIIWSPLVIVNLAFSIIILALGYLAYTKNNNKLAFSIGAGFGLFAVSHLIAFLGLSGALLGFLILIRLLAYFIIISALYRAGAK